jgi:hypothetical protein
MHVTLYFYLGKTRRERKNPEHERREKNKTTTMITMNMTWQVVLGGLGLTLCTIEHIERKQDHEWELMELV